MRCEVCGREILGPSSRRVIEGAKMTVCSVCAKFGTENWTPSKPRTPQRRRRLTNEVEVLESLNLIEDYGEQIRKARQGLRMTVEELGRKIGEKTSVIKKLEKEEFSPDRRLVRKLKNALKVDLLVEEQSTQKLRTVKPSGGRTIGELIKISPEVEEDSEQ